MTPIGVGWFCNPLIIFFSSGSDTRPLQLRCLNAAFPNDATDIIVEPKMLLHFILSTEMLIGTVMRQNKKVSQHILIYINKDDYLLRIICSIC